MATITIDAGHGGVDPGATNGMRRESADVLGLSMAVGKILECRCHRVIYTRQSDIFIPLEQRARISNDAGANAFVSIHRNANANLNANGIDTFIRFGATQAERSLATNILNRMNALGVFANRGVANGNFLVLNQTNAPATLVEASFISNAADNARFDQNASRLATAIANGIEDSVGRVANCNSGGTTAPPPANQNLKGTIRTSGGNLNLRSSPSTQSAVIGSIPNGTEIEILAEQNGFYRTKFANATGWVSSDFVQPIPQAARVSTQGGALNLRSAPLANAQVIAAMPNNSSITVSDIIGNFYLVAFGPQRGFASRDFISLGF